MLFRSKPPPPPDVVPAIEPDVTGATTIRQRLAKHRADPACAECHRRIDPLGFSLENFDPIGRWRTAYAKPKGAAPAPKVDASGQFSSGEAYDGFEGFRRILVEGRADVFARHLARQFLSFASGRHLGPADDFVVDDILAAVRREGDGLRALIVESLASEVVRSR